MPGNSGRGNEPLPVAFRCRRFRRQGVVVAQPEKNRTHKRRRTTIRLSENLFPSSRRPCPNDSFPLTRGYTQLSKRIHRTVEAEKAIQHRAHQESAAASELILIKLRID